MVNRSKLTKKEIAERLEIDPDTLRRYRNGEREMTTELYFKLILITKYYAIIPILLKELKREWLGEKKKKDVDTKEAKRHRFSK